MKPYFLVTYNLLRLGWRRLLSRGNFQVSTVQLLGWNTKLSIHPLSRVSLGRRLVSDGRLVIMTGSGARLTIGDGVYFNEGAMLSCKERLTIGSGCRFGPNVKVFDNDHKYDAVHGVSADHVTAPVEIGNNCWFGSNVVILRGTTIGDNCVIGAGCVVKGNIPDGSLVTIHHGLDVRPIRRKE